jgi:ADP-heptose:LPS heptosyltransferase
MHGLNTKLLIDYYAGGFLHALLKPPTVLLGRLLRRDHNLARCSSVTFLKMMGGGSLVMAYPALLAIRQKANIREMKLVTTPEVLPFARILGVFDEIIVIRDSALSTILLDSFNVFRKLFRCEAIVDLEIHSRLTTVFCLLTCARNRVGFYTGVSFWRKNLSTHLLFFNMANPVYWFYDQVANLFEANLPPLQDCMQSFQTNMALDEPVMKSGSLVLFLAPCCSALGKERMLLPKDWIGILQRRLAAVQVDIRVEIHVLGGPADRDALNQLGGMIARQIANATVVNHAGLTSLRDAVKLVARADELLCIDSSMLHFARLLGVPTTSFWGPTDPVTRLRPFPGSRDVVYYQKLSCSPCVHMADHPPCNGDNVCMRFALEPDREGCHHPVWPA